MSLSCGLEWYNSNGSNVFGFLFNVVVLVWWLWCNYDGCSCSSDRDMTASVVVMVIMLVVL